MKAILEFNLPEDKTEYLAATKSIEWALTVFEINEWLRNAKKYNNHGFKTPNEALEGCANQLHAIMEFRNLNLNEIV